MAFGDKFFKVVGGLELDNDRLIFDSLVSPKAGAGIAAPVGSICCQSDGVIWRKFDTGDTDWSPLEIIVTGGATGVDPTTPVVIDSVAVASYAAVKWLAVIQSNSTPANRRGYEVYGMNDASTGVDDTQYAVLKTNTKPSGLSLTVDIDSGNMRLVLSGTEDMDYSFVRIPVAIPA